MILIVLFIFTEKLQSKSTPSDLILKSNSILLIQGFVAGSDRGSAFVRRRDRWQRRNATGGLYWVDLAAPEHAGVDYSSWSGVGAQLVDSGAFSGQTHTIRISTKSINTQANIHSHLQKCGKTYSISTYTLTLTLTEVWENSTIL